MTIVPRTGPFSASSARATTSWYQRGKSTARGVSAPLPALGVEGPAAGAVMGAERTNAHSRPPSSARRAGRQRTGGRRLRRGVPEGSRAGGPVAVRGVAPADPVDPQLRRVGVCALLVEQLPAVRLGFRLGACVRSREPRLDALGDE